MNKKKKPVLKAAVPVLAVEDLGEALDYYGNVLGFQVGWTWGDPPHLASVCRDTVELNLGQKRKAGPHGASRVYVQMDGVDAYYERTKAAGAKITTLPDDRLYGMRDFNIQDPSGNDLGFGEPMVGDSVSGEETAVTSFTKSRFVIAVPKLQSSAEFYRNVLGFTVRTLGDPGWLLYERDNCVIMAGECPDALPPRELGDHAYFAYIVVSGIDDFYRSVQAKDAD